MSDPQALLDGLAAMQQSWPGQPWAWDARMVAFASTFDATVAAKVRESVARTLPQTWSSITLAQASEPLRALCAKTGGLRTGQELLTGDGAFGLWWPWGGGKTITLRLGLCGATVTDDLRAKVRAVMVR